MAAGGAAPLGPAQEQLLVRMNEKLDEALMNMQQHGRKIGHWAWWAFPTEMPGKSEPGPATCVTKATANGVLERAPKIWRQLLECVCDLVEKDGKDVLPSIDHGRVEYFIRFWDEVDRRPKWMRSVLRRLKKFYGPGARAGRRRSSGGGARQGR